MRVLPTRSWVSTRRGSRVGPLPTGLEPADPPRLHRSGAVGAGVAAPPQAPTMRATAATNAASGNARPGARRTAGGRRGSAWRQGSPAALSRHSRPPRVELALRTGASGGVESAGFRTRDALLARGISTGGPTRRTVTRFQKLAALTVATTLAARHDRRHRPCDRLGPGLPDWPLLQRSVPARPSATIKAWLEWIHRTVGVAHRHPDPRPGDPRLARPPRPAARSCGRASAAVALVGFQAWLGRRRPSASATAASRSRPTWPPR